MTIEAIIGLSAVGFSLFVWLYLSLYGEKRCKLCLMKESECICHLLANRWR